MYPTKKFSEIAKTTSGWTPSRDKKEYWWWSIPWLKSGELWDNLNIEIAEEFITEEGFKNSSAKLFAKWTLLIAMYGATAGKLWILWFDATTNQAVCSVQNIYNLFIEKYVYFFLLSIREKIIWDSFWWAQPNISKSYLDNLEIPLPPLSTQSKIVAKLDEAFGNIDHQISLLKANIEDVESVRKSAMEEFISKNTNFKNLSEVIITNDLWLVRWQNEQSDEFDTFYIKMNNIWNFNWKISLGKLTKINATNDEKIKYLLRKWDLLFNTRNSFELVWKTALFDMDWEYLFNNNILRMRFISEISSEYINYIFLTSFIQNQLHWMKSGTTNVSAIYFKNLKNLKIPLPPLPRQQEIVGHLDRVFAQTAELRSSYEAQIRDLETLRQSLLEEAFAGRLVSE